ncbi:MAG: hypothetical protein JNK85_23850 [Verrucomicrobiales bacterium]|nr:hypothetical protein [Verrucomicrobiales bacterium]
MKVASWPTPCVDRTQHRIPIRDKWSAVIDEQRVFLSLVNPPARLTAQQAAWFLGFTEQQVAILTRAGLLCPLGRPPRNGLKYYASAQLATKRNDAKWLAKASDTIVNHWKRRNARRRRPRNENPPSCPLDPGIEDGILSNRP